jgi:hypothetical protein
MSSLRTQEFINHLSTLKCQVTLSKLVEINQESDLTKKSQLINALGKRGIKQLQRIEESCNQEIAYLLRNLKPNTVMVSITAYRRAIKNWDNDHPALMYFKLPKDAYVKRNTEYSQNVDNDSRNLKPFKQSNIQPYIDRLISMLSSDSYIAVAMGICGLTGRRPGEILTTAIFTTSNECKYSDSSLVFTGQLKGKKSEKARDNYEIPVLCSDEKIIISALDRLRKMKDFSTMVVPIEKTLGQCVNLSTAKGQSQCVQKYLSEFFPDNQVKPYNLRALYIAIANHLYRPNTVAENVFFSELLGHSEQDKESFKSYEDFYIDKTL